MPSISVDPNEEELDCEDHPQSWAQRMDIQWELRFEQCEPLTKDQVIYINMRDEKNSKLIFISKNLDHEELQNLIELIRNTLTSSPRFTKICQDWIQKWHNIASILNLT